MKQNIMKISSPLLVEKEKKKLHITLENNLHLQELKVMMLVFFMLKNHAIINSTNRNYI